MKFKHLREAFDNKSYHWYRSKGWSDHYFVDVNEYIQLHVYFKEPDEEYYDEEYYDGDGVEVIFEIKDPDGTWVQSPDASSYKNEVNMFRFFKSLMEIIKDFVKNSSSIKFIVFNPFSLKQERLYLKICEKFLPSKWDVFEGDNGYYIIMVKK